MTIASNLQRIIDAKAAIKAAIIEKGVEVPDTEKLDAYYSYIDQIGGGGGSWDPENPTLEGLKYAIDNGIDIPAGTEIPDTYDGHNNPLIVAQKLDSSNNSSYGGAEGVILVRKYVEPTAMQLGSNSKYNESAIKTFLDTSYYDNCSDDLKQLLATINIPYYNGSSTTSIPSKWFLMSDREVCSNRGSAENGIEWSYWKEKTGLASPSSSANEGRIVYGSDGVAYYAWLRSLSTAFTSFACVINASGSIVDSAPIQNYGVLPACFIAKTSGGDSPELPDLPDLSQPLNDEGLEALSTIVKSGKASEYLNLGDELLINYAEYVMPFEVVGFESAEVEGGSTVPSINLLAKYTTGSAGAYGASGSTKYSASTLRTKITGAYQNNFDSNFIACLGNTKVQTYSRDGSTDVVYDKLFAPSMTQLGITDAVFNSANQVAVEGPAFAAYQGANNAKRIKNAINATTTAQYWWTRSMSITGGGAFSLILKTGAPEGITYAESFCAVAACNFIGKD